MLIAAQVKKCHLFDPSIADVLEVTENLPADEIQQIELISGEPFSPDKVAIWFYGTHFKIACRAGADTIAVCGFSPIGPGVYRTFFMATEAAWAEHGRELTELTIYGMNDIIEQQGIRRLETVCLKSRELAQKWYSTLGLKHESTLKAYANDGQDCVMFTKTRT